MKYRWIENIKEFEFIAHDWDRELISTGDNNPFLLSDFIITWWKYHYNNHLCILAIYDQDKIVGGIPLFVKKERLCYGLAKVMRYIGLNVANYTEPLYGTSDFKLMPILLDALGERKDWEVLHLTDIRVKNRLIKECFSLPQNQRFPFYILQDHMDWAIDLSRGKDSFIASRSKKMMRDLRSKRRHVIKEYGQIKLKEIKGKGEIEKYFDLYIKFSLNSFNSRNKKSTFGDPNNSNFFKEFLVTMDSKGRLDAHILFAGDEVLAISFGYRFGKGFNWILTGFNREHKFVRPGYLLIEELISEITRRGETYYNWYGHSKFYKSQWCNVQTPLFQVFLINPSWRGYLYKIIHYNKSRLKSNGKFMNIFHKTQKTIYKLRALVGNNSNKNIFNN